MKVSQTQRVLKSEVGGWARLGSAQKVEYKGRIQHWWDTKVEYKVGRDSGSMD